MGVVSATGLRQVRQGLAHDGVSGGPDQLSVHPMGDCWVLQGLAGGGRPLVDPDGAPVQSFDRGRIPTGRVVALGPVHLLDLHRRGRDPATGLIDADGVYRGTRLGALPTAALEAIQSMLRDPEQHADLLSVLRRPGLVGLLDEDFRDHVVFDPVLEQDGVLMLRTGDGPSLPLLSEDGRPIVAYPDEMTPRLLYAGLSDLLMLQFEGAAGAHELWILDRTGRRLGRRVTDLDHAQLGLLRSALAEAGFDLFVADAPRPPGAGLALLELGAAELTSALRLKTAGKRPPHPDRLLRSFASSPVPPGPRLCFEGLFAEPDWDRDEGGAHVARSRASAIRFTVPDAAECYRLTLTVGVQPQHHDLVVSVNGIPVAASRIMPTFRDRPRRLDYPIPAAQVAGTSVTCRFESGDLPVTILEAVMTASGFMPKASVALDDKALMARFGSLGVDCEFGFAQRHVGIEPLGLFRFAGTHGLWNMLRHLDEDFAELTTPGAFTASINGDEWFLGTATGTYVFHTWQHPNSISYHDIVRQTEQKVTYLARSLIEDFEDGEKIWIYKSLDDIDVHEVLSLHRSINRHGPNKLVWVSPATSANPHGSLEWVTPLMLRGYLAGMTDNGQLSNASAWVALCRRSYEAFELHHLPQLDQPAPPPPRRPNFAGG